MVIVLLRAEIRREGTGMGLMGLVKVEKKEEKELKEGMFKPWYPPATGTRLEDLLPIERKAGKTPIDGLDITFLPQENFFLDVVRNAGRDNIEVSVRCDSGVMAEAEAREFVAEVRRRVEGVVGELET
ncbi:hypothetical protein ABVK25_011694 [Lepraria finkii]|uniref:Uncharacterized protein n=1 Tax=Lepraria finkii TaxID=1340010 RepID=A0ABR4AT32_9LECA